MTFDEVILRVARDDDGQDRTPVQIATMIVVDKSEAPISIGAVAHALDCNKPRITRSVDVLVELGWMTRADNPDDRRRCDLRLTDAGREVLARLRGEMPPEMCVGARIRDNDPRSAVAGLPRMLIVRGFALLPRREYVIASIDGNTSAGETCIRLDRIHADGKPRKSGWSVVA